MWTKKVDRMLLILTVLHELYQNNGIPEVRRARLKELCDDRLNQETDGLQDSFGGGSFEWCLKNLEEQGLLGRVRKKKRRKLSLFRT
jgi:hypothetical protein